MSVLTRVLSEEEMVAFLRESKRRSLEAIRSEVEKELSSIRKDQRTRRRMKIRREILKGSISYTLAQL
jgi:hypothetical protein